MTPHFNRWMLVATVSTIALLVALTQAIPMVFSRSAGRTDEALVAAATIKPVATTVPTLAPTLRPTSTPVAKPSPTALPIPTGKQLVSVQRGTLAETLPLSGRVSAEQEAPLTFSIRGAVQAVNVQPGQSVSQGDLLMTLDSNDAAHQLSDAQSQLQITQARLQQLQANVASQNQVRQQQAALQDQRTQQQIADATAQAQQQLDKARADYARVNAGASTADKLTAQAAVVTAQAALDKAQSDLAKLQASPTQADIAAAQQLVNTAQLALKKAQSDRDTLLKPADPAIIAAAQKEVADAQAAVAHANAPDDPHANGPKLTDDERQQLQQSAQYALTAAKAHLAQAQKGPDKNAVDLANMAVDSANSDFANAQAHLQQVKAGPTADELTAAQNAVQSAQLGLQAAQLHLNDVNSHPTQDELDAAQQQIDAAQAALDKAGQSPADAGASAAAPAAAAGGSGDTSSSPLIDQMTLQHTAQQLTQQIQTLQQQIQASQMRAPFSGTIESVQVKQGDSVDQSRPVLIIASSGPPLVTVDATDLDSRLAVGQSVDIPGTSADTSSKGSIVAINDGPSGSGKQAQMQVDWTGAVPAIGVTVQLNVTLNTKNDVLVIPQQALHTSGTRRTVEILDGTTRRSVEVQTGATSADQVEIVSGLSEGQQVILPS